MSLSILEQLSIPSPYESIMETVDSDRLNMYANETINCKVSLNTLYHFADMSSDIDTFRANLRRLDKILLVNAEDMMGDRIESIDYKNAGITLKNFYEYKGYGDTLLTWPLQKVYNKLFLGLSAQNFQRATTGNRCFYQYPDAQNPLALLHCPVGWTLIQTAFDTGTLPDCKCGVFSAFSVSHDTVGFQRIIPCRLLNFLSEIQIEHDRQPTFSRETIMDIARDFGLNPDVDDYLQTTYAKKPFSRFQ